ncbi:Cystinosin homolog [Linum perenne]
MASWNSIPLEVTYQTLGWLAFVSWSISFYPQVILNFRRKRSFTHLPFFILFPVSQMIPVAANDVAFSIHAVVLTVITLFQVFIYERGTQKISRISIVVVSVVWLLAAVCFFVALHSHAWLWLITIFNSIQVFMTIIKYIPQVVMNVIRKSTEGFSIGNILLDFTGGVANYAQMAVLSIDQNSWVNFYGNIGKTLLSLVSIFFDIIFMVQHYILYGAKKTSDAPGNADVGNNDPLIESSVEQPQTGSIV